MVSCARVPPVGLLVLLLLGGAACFTTPPPSAGPHMPLFRHHQGRSRCTPKGTAAVLLQRAAPATTLSLKEDGGDGEEKGMWEKIKDSFKEGVDEDGKSTISEAERTMSYAVDLVTVTAGAAVFTCLFLNLMGKVPCI
uniref:Uncharacterized protein n=1 Tax=Hemiselmis tepida TaxID=464990 RepID=A0A7S0W3H4_9CRYP|mmetsp:Transcript_38773/g.99071  ORF Transcript_38773/g.99071 Transcript_38773/m.99071 type:complete len:138 (+) Transcript_38773:117-530(+)